MNRRGAIIAIMTAIAGAMMAQEKRTDLLAIRPHQPPEMYGITFESKGLRITIGGETVELTAEEILKALKGE